MTRTQLSKAVMVPRKALQPRQTLHQSNGSRTPAIRESGPPILIPEKLTDWVPAPVLLSLATEAVRTLCWADEPESDNAADNLPDSITATLVTATYCLALGECGCEAISVRAISDENLAQFSGLKAPHHQLHLICSHHSNSLKCCLARVFERVWIFRHGGLDLETAASIAFMPAVFQARFGAKLRWAFRDQAEQRIQRTLSSNRGSDLIAILKGSPHSDCASEEQATLGVSPQEPALHGQVESSIAPTTSDRATPRLRPPRQATQSGSKRALCWLIICLLAFVALLACRAGQAYPAGADKQGASTAPDPPTAPTKQAQPAAQEDLGSIVIDGKTNRVVRVQSADPVCVFLIYESKEVGKGGRRIPRQDLPPQLQAKYPYDAAKAAQYRHQQADVAAQQMALSIQQTARLRTAAREAMTSGIRAQIEALRDRDVELQKEKNILNSLPRGNGRRVRSQHISNEQEGLRRQIAQLAKQLEQISAQMGSTP